MATSQSDLSINYNRKRKTGDLLNETEIYFSIEDTHHVEFSYIDTITAYIPSEIPRHYLLGNTKRKKTQNQEECLFLRFSSLVSSYTLPENTFKYIEKFTQTTKECCDSLSKMVANGRKFGVSPDVISYLMKTLDMFHNELNTWVLLRLMIIHVIETPKSGHYLAKNIEDSLSSYFERNSSIKFYNLLLCWLEKCYLIKKFHLINRNISSLSSDTTYRSCTHKYLLSHPGINNSVVNHLDPDAPFRENLPICQEDKATEDFLYRVMFEVFRSGHSVEMLSLCDLADQTWRKLSIMDLRNFQPQIHKKINLDTSISQLNNYQLWKDSALKLSNNNKVNEFERAIYGVLTGNINSILPICYSYNDLLWCHLSCSVYKSVEKVVYEFSNNRDHSSFKDDNLENTSFELAEIFNKIKKFTLNDSDEDKFYQQLQKSIIFLDHNINEKIRNNFYVWSNNDNILRFLTHFLLIYKNFVLVEDVIFADVISNYVKMLIRLKKYEIIALYVSLMPCVYQIPTYASALETLKIRENKNEFIELAKKHGIDHIEVCKTVSIKVVEKYLVNIKISPISADATFDTLDFINYILIIPETHVFAFFVIFRVCDFHLLTNNFDATNEFFNKLSNSLFFKIKQKHISSSSDDCHFTLLNYKYKYIHKILELEKLLKKSSNILNFPMKSNIYFPRLKSDASSSLDATFNLDNILDRIIIEALKLIRISEKFSLVLSDFNFNVISDLPYIGNELKENSFKILSMFTNDILNVVFSVHHYRSNHIKCLQVSHLLAKFPKQLINLISKDNLKEMVKNFAECFTCVDFPDD